MNFLSHYYLHNDQNDNYFTVGLTIPDLLGFHSRSIRITNKFLKQIGLIEKDKNIKSFIAGMMVHLFLDKWFHNLDFFKEKVSFLQDYYRKFNDNKDKLPHFFAHILLEILLDRYLLNLTPNIANDFYTSYQKFNFCDITRLFVDQKHFDKQKFISFANNVANSSFLKEYIHDHLIISIFHRVSKRINIPMSLSYDDNQFISFIRKAYDKLIPSIKNTFNEAKNIPIDKDEIINSLG